MIIIIVIMMIVMRILIIVIMTIMHGRPAWGFRRPDAPAQGGAGREWYYYHYY